VVNFLTHILAGTRKHALLVFSVFVIFLCQQNSVWAQDLTPATSGLSTGTKKSLSPRNSLEEFLKLTQNGEFEAATKFVELPPELSDTKRDAKIFQVAREINKVASLFPIILSNKESGDLNDYLPPHQEILFDVPTTQGTKVRVLLNRVVRDDDALMESWWSLPYSEFKKILSMGDSTKKSFKIESWLPYWLDTPILGWASPASFIGFIIIVLTSITITYVLRITLSVGIARFSNSAFQLWNSISYPLQLFAATKLVSSDLIYLELPFTARQALDRTLFVISSFCILFVAINSTAQIVATTSRALTQAGKEENSPFLPLIRRVLNVILTITMILLYD